MPLALKAAWLVQAGVIRKEPLPHLTKRFEYTDADAEYDSQQNPQGKNLAYHSRLAKVRAAAIDYFLQVSPPQLNNWATITFTSYLDYEQVCRPSVHR
jgi:hypothetical protein